jgi:DNA polymerase-3 subunit epsilon
LSSRDKHGALIDAELLTQVYLELTCGKQNDLRFNISNKDIKKKVDFKSRKFVLSVEEEELHNEMLKKMKNNLWQ